MALTRDFKLTVIELCKDPAFREGLLCEIIECWRNGDIELGNGLLGYYKEAEMNNMNRPGTSGF